MLSIFIEVYARAGLLQLGVDQAHAVKEYSAFRTVSSSSEEPHWMFVMFFFFLIIDQK